AGAATATAHAIELNSSNVPCGRLAFAGTSRLRLRGAGREARKTPAHGGRLAERESPCAKKKLRRSRSRRNWLADFPRIGGERLIDDQPRIIPESEINRIAAAEQH